MFIIYSAPKDRIIIIIMFRSVWFNSFVFVLRDGVALQEPVRRNGRCDARCKLSNFNRNVKTFSFVPNEIWQFMQIDTTADPCEARSNPVCEAETRASTGWVEKCFVLSFFQSVVFDFDFFCRSSLAHSCLFASLWEEKKLLRISFQFCFFLVPLLLLLANAPFCFVGENCHSDSRHGKQNAFWRQKRKNAKYSVAVRLRRHHERRWDGECSWVSEQIDIERQQKRFSIAGDCSVFLFTVFAPANGKMHTFHIIYELIQTTSVQENLEMFFYQEVGGGVDKVSLNVRKEYEALFWNWKQFHCMEFWFRSFYSLHDALMLNEIN